MTDTTVKCEIDVPLERITNCITGAIEGGSSYWCNTFVPLPASADIVADIRAKGGVWYDEAEFWERGGGAHLEFDKPTEDSTGEANIGLQQLQNGLNILAAKYGRHFGDLLNENDDANTHDLFLQCVLFGEEVFA